MSNREQMRRSNMGRLAIDLTNVTQLYIKAEMAKGRQGEEITSDMITEITGFVSGCITNRVCKEHREEVVKFMNHFLRESFKLYDTFIDTKED